LLEERDGGERDIDRHERWNSAKLMKFNKAKCKVLHLHQGNHWYQYRPRDKRIESSPAEKDLGVLVDDKLNMSRQCVLAVQKANHILGCMPSSMASRSREMILRLCSTLVRAYLESCVQLWSLQHRQDMNLLEQVYRRPQKWSEGWNTSPMRKG